MDNIVAFQNDYLNRFELVKEWTDALLPLKLNHNLVISISGDWGTGKTYLSQNWCKYLLENNYFSCYIDAHKQDYAEDPLLVIMNEIENNLKLYKKDKNSKTKSSLTRKMNMVKKKLHIINKCTLKTATSIALPEILSYVVKELFEQVDKQNIKSFIYQFLEEYENQKDKYIKNQYSIMSSYSSYIKAFKDAVENFTLDFNKPVVIFIDELDRSNPTFVIKLIEQLKHIFDINNLVFILTVNKHELSNTIKSLYGSEMDGYAYYKKFITHDFTLYPIEYIDKNNIVLFINEYVRLKESFDLSNEFIVIMADIIEILNLSLRDIEQILDHIYYIRDKVQEDYHKEYLIICLFYRAIYMKDYKAFIEERENMEMLDCNIIYEVHNNIKINKLFKLIANNFNTSNHIFNILSIIVSIPKKEDLLILERNFKPPYIYPPFRGTDSFHIDIKYIYYPIFTYINLFNYQ